VPVALEQRAQVGKRSLRVGGGRLCARLAGVAHPPIVGSQRADSIVIFKIDQTSGELKPTGDKVEVGTPICIRFLPIAK